MDIVGIHKVPPRPKIRTKTKTKKLGMIGSGMTLHAHIELCVTLYTVTVQGMS